MLMIKGSPQPLSIWQHAVSAQSCGFGTFSDEVDGQAERDNGVWQMCFSRPLPILSGPHQQVYWSPDLFYFLWSEQLDYNKLVFKVWLKFQVLDQGSELKTPCLATKTLSLQYPVSLISVYKLNNAPNYLFSPWVLVRINESLLAPGSS